MTSEEQDYKNTLDAVKRGYEGAKTKLAWYMLSGHGGAVVDAKGAVALLEERVKEGDAGAMWMLGVCCEFGIGIEQDRVRASGLNCQSRDRGSQIGKTLAMNTGGRGSGYLRIKCLWNHTLWWMLAVRLYMICCDSL